MSHPNTPHPADGAAHDAHEGPIRTPKQLIWAVVLAFVVPILLIILLTRFVFNANLPHAGSTALDEQSIARRIAPLGRLDFKDASGPVALRTGEQVYNGQCAACHGTGAAGAPKLGDAAAWGPRLGQGYEALHTSALKGKNAMPPQSGGEFSDYEIGRAVVYMANQAGGKLAEPPAPAASGAASAASAAN